MKLTAFRVLNYRCVNDSGWIDVDRMAVLVGKNQSGKSALLQALHKLNPYQANPYTMDREWPRGRRKDRDSKAPAIMARFTFSEGEVGTLNEIAGTQVPGSLEVIRTYDGEVVLQFFDGFNPNGSTAPLPASTLEKVRTFRNLGDKECSDAFRSAVQSYCDDLERLVSDQDQAQLSSVLQEARQRLDSAASTEEPTATPDNEVLNGIINNAEALAATLAPASSVRDLLEKQITGWLPVFVYMDDYRLYRGSTFLNQLKERRDGHQLSEEDETILILMEMAGLDLDNQIAKVSPNDREQRALDLNDASITLTNEMKGRWSQEQYIVQFHADQYHFITFVKNPGQSALVPLEEESRGFQWFFSFDLHFAHETKGTLKGAVLLLDEPGLHLHPKAQTDLLNRLEAYCEDNQLIPNR